MRSYLLHGTKNSSVPFREYLRQQILILPHLAQWRWCCLEEWFPEVKPVILVPGTNDQGILFVLV